MDAAGKDYLEREDSEKLKVGILSFYYPHLGGSGIISSRIAENLAKRGHEVHIIGYDTDVNPSHMEDLGINLHRVRKIDYPCLKNEPYIWSLASEICNVDDKFDLDVIHANYAIPHAASAYLARENRRMNGKSLPYVITGHGSDIHTNGKKGNIGPILELTLNSADALTYVSSELEDIARNELNVKKKGFVIPNFVDPERFYKKEVMGLREKLGIPPESFVIGHVSNFAPIKQVHHFSYLAENLKQSGSLYNIHFLMVGDGSERTKLESRVEKIGAKENFHFVGKKLGEELLDFYNIMDCFVLPSKHEGNPLTLLEAMACEKPVIGSKVGGITETIGGEGLLFERGNIMDLLDNVLSLKENKDSRDIISKKGYEKIMKNHLPDKILDNYLEVFRGVIGRDL